MRISKPDFLKKFGGSPLKARYQNSQNEPLGALDHWPLHLWLTTSHGKTWDQDQGGKGDLVEKIKAQDGPQLGKWRMKWNILMG